MRNYVTKMGRFGSEQKMLLGISAVLGEETLELAGEEYDARAVAALLQERLDATAKVEPLRVQYLKAVQEERDALERTRERLADLRTLLVLKYKDRPEVLAELGLAPPKKRKKMTGKEIVAMAAKAEATRHAIENGADRSR